MRAILVDANVIVSSILPSGAGPSIVRRVVNAGIAGSYRLLIGATTLGEVEAVYIRKRYLRANIPPDRFAFALSALRAAAEILPPPDEPIHPVCRDPRDDYLIALALTNAATHLLTGDRDLLALDDGRFPFRILDASELAAELGIPGEA